MPFNGYKSTLYGDPGSQGLLVEIMRPIEYIDMILAPTRWGLRNAIRVLLKARDTVLCGGNSQTDQKFGLFVHEGLSEFQRINDST